MMVNFKINILKLPQLPDYRASGLVQLLHNGKFTVLFNSSIVLKPISIIRLVLFFKLLNLASYVCKIKRFVIYFPIVSGVKLLCTKLSSELLIFKQCVGY